MLDLHLFHSSIPQSVKTCTAGQTLYHFVLFNVVASFTLASKNLMYGCMSSAALAETLARVSPADPRPQLYAVRSSTFPLAPTRGASEQHSEPASSKASQEFGSATQQEPQPKWLQTSSQK